MGWSNATQSAMSLAKEYFSAGTPSAFRVPDIGLFQRI